MNLGIVTMAKYNSFFISFTPYSVCSKCLFLHWSSLTLIFLPSLFNVRPKVAYNPCHEKLFTKLRVFLVSISVHDFIFHFLFSSSFTFVYRVISNEFCLN